MALADNHALHCFVLRTEQQIRAVERREPPPSATQSEWTMWVPITALTNPPRTDLSLEEVRTDDDYAAMTSVRLAVERDFGIDDPTVVAGFVADIRRKAMKLGGRWYLGFIDDKPVAEVGMIPFQFGALRVGRLQDVDVVPDAQRRGVGRKLLLETCRLAREQNLHALCLMARSDDWPKDWYARFGFERVGETS